MSDMIQFQVKGDFSKVNTYLEKLKEKVRLGTLDKYGRMGVQALSANTPVDTGLTANSWYYEVTNQNGVATITFANSNVKDGWCNIAIILQYGHGTKNGGWVEGRDYINPALRPVFDKMIKDLWEEVTRV